MFGTWKILTITRNMSDGEAHFFAEKATEKEAMDVFYNNCSSYGTNPQTKSCAVYVIMSNGTISRMEFIDNTKYAVEE